MNRDQISHIVERVLGQIQQGEMPAKVADYPAQPKGVFKTVDSAMDAARHAHEVLVEIPLEKRREIIANIRIPGEIIKLRLQIFLRQLGEVVEQIVRELTPSQLT